MNSLRMLLHLMAITALAAFACVLAWWGHHIWNQTHPRKRTGHYVVMKSNDNALAVQGACHAFFKVYGRWPANWKEVRKSLIFQRDLYSLDSKHRKIDPDDGRMDFETDVVYKPGMSPEVVGNRLGLPLWQLSAPTTYKQWLPAIEARLNNPMSQTLSNFQTPDSAFKAQNYLSSKDRLVQLAILYQLCGLAARSNALQGQTPTLTSVLSHPAAPIDRTSINPLTGKPFRFDGSANDVWITDGVGGPLTMIPILANGIHPTYYFTP